MSPAPCPPSCCPSCHLPYDCGKRRVLLDSCGHQRCYQCLFATEDCPQCQTGRLTASPAMSVRSLEPGAVYGSVGPPAPSARMLATPPVGRRPAQYRPSPVPGGRRPNWIQRYNRRPNTVNIDDKSMSGKCRPSDSCPVQLRNKLTSSTALLRSQVLGVLPEHESLKLRTIWVLGSNMT